MNFSSQKILITRPEPAASQTVAVLDNLGCPALASPLMQTQAKQFSWPKDRFDAVVLTSARSVQTIGALPKTIANCPTYCVGSATQDAARLAGFLHTVPLPKPVNTVKKLASHLANSNEPGAVLYVCGTQRSNDLSALLQPFGFTTTLIETYSLTPNKISQDALNAFRAGRIWAVAHYSSATARRFIDQAKQNQGWIDLQKLAHICMSENIADILRQSGCGNIELAQTPTNTAMLDKCQLLFSKLA